MLTRQNTLVQNIVVTCQITSDIFIVKHASHYALLNHCLLAAL